MICSANQLTGFYMMGTLLVKGLRNKFEALQESRHYSTLGNKIGWFVSFSTIYFKRLPYMLDRSSNGGGLLPYKVLKVKPDCNIESTCVEVNLMK